jgi:hypothetical protein
MNLSKTTLTILAGLALIFTACNEDQVPKPIDQIDDTTDPIVISNLDLILGNWKIYDAVHDGDYDGSSMGKTVKFNDVSNYNFDNSFPGTYTWSSDSATLYLDAGTQYAQDWTITTLAKDTFIVDFKSPFTGKPSNWKMKSTF